MSYALYKNGRMLFIEWRSTGGLPASDRIILKPWELTMRIRIRFKDRGMCSSFLQAMEKIGYQKREISTNGIMVEFMFDKPRSPQPLTRTDETVGSFKEHERICNHIRKHRRVWTLAG